jgi:ABC-type glycerol-3-phosphate transport system substrate-binding protein
MHGHDAVTHPEAAAGTGPPAPGRGPTRRGHLRSGSAVALAALWAGACAGAEDTAPAPAAQPVQLEFQFYLPQTHPAGGTWRKVLQGFSRTTDQKITFNTLGWEGDTTLDKLLTYITAGTPPDAWYGGFFDLTPLLAQGAAVPLDDAMKGIAEWRRRRDDLSPLMRDTLTWKGRLAGMPVDRNFIAVAYHRGHLRKAGLADPKGDWKWDDLLAMARKAASPPEVWGLDYRFDAGYTALLFWLQFYASAGGQLLNKEATRVTVQNTEAERTSQWLYDLVHSHRLAAFPSQFELLRTEKTVFEQQGPYRLPTFRQLNVDLGVVRNPAPGFGRPTRITYGSGSGLAILKGRDGSRVTPAARAALAMVEPEAQALLVTEGGNMPVTTSGFERKEVKDFGAKDPEFGAWLAETPYATRVQALPSGQKLYNEMAGPLVDYFNQKTGLREALEKMQIVGQRLLDEEHRL